MNNSKPLSETEFVREGKNCLQPPSFTGEGLLMGAHSDGKRDDGFNPKEGERFKF